MKKDYYKILGIDSTATLKEIKTAYKKLVKKYHPDKNLDDDTAHEKFQEIEEAYRVLKDPINRAHFDQTGNGNMPKSKDMAVQKLILLFQKHIKQAIEAELKLEVIYEATRHTHLFESIDTDRSATIVSNIREELTEEKRATVQAIEGLEKGVAKLNAYKRKVISKGATDLYAQVIEQQLAATSGALAAGGIQLIVVETALNALDDYEYVVEDALELTTDSATG